MRRSFRWTKRSLLTVAQVVIPLDQPVEQALFVRAPDLANHQRLQRPQRTSQRTLVHEKVRGRLGPPRQRVRGRKLPRRQFDVPGTVQGQHQTPADHVAPRAIGLSPVPRLTDQHGKLPPAGTGVLVDDRGTRFRVAPGSWGRVVYACEDRDIPRLGSLLLP